MLMQKRKLLLLSAFLLSGIFIILILYGLSYKINHRENGFIRLFPPHKIAFTQSLILKYSGYYIAGATQNHIYLGNHIASSQLITTNYSFTDTQHVQLLLPDDTSKFAWKALRVVVDSPHLYMMEGITPTILHSIYPFTKTSRNKLSNIRFDQPIPISPSSFAFRTYDTTLKQDILVKENTSPLKVTMRTNILEKQIDGRFCTDGTLLYDKDASRLIYIYYYRNQFICLDTNLNIIYRAKTIDTTNRAQLKVVNVKSTHSLTLSAPPLVVNRKSCLSSDWLFVNSVLLANNEIKDSFDQHSVIDVYSIKNGQYQFSFYLPNVENKRLKSFGVFKKNLIALYDHYGYIYHIKF